MCDHCLFRLPRALHDAAIWRANDQGGHGGFRRERLKIPHSRRSRIGGAIILVLVASTFTAAALQAHTHPDPGTRDGAIVWAVIAAFFWLLLVFAIRRGRGYLTITPTEIRHHGGSFYSVLPWTDVQSIFPAYHKDEPTILITGFDQARWEHRRLSKVPGVDKPPKLRRDDGQPGDKPVIAIRCVYFRVDPALLLAILQFYAHNPNARTELATDASLHRARTGAFA